MGASCTVCSQASSPAARGSISPVEGVNSLSSERRSSPSKEKRASVADDKAKRTSVKQKSRPSNAEGRRSRCSKPEIDTLYQTSTGEEEKTSEAVGPQEEALREDVRISTKGYKVDLKAIFRRVDRDKNGDLDVAELSQLLRAMKVRYTAKSVKGLMELMDTSGNGSIDFDEFLSFFARDEKRDLEHFVQQELAKKAAEQKDGKLDVYIIHAMAQEVGERKSWWLANVLENGGLTCAVPYMERAMAPENRERFGFHTPCGTSDDEGKGVSYGTNEVTNCRLLVLLVNAESLVCSQEKKILDRAADEKLPVCCFYEVSPGYKEDLHSWRKNCPLAFAETVARPMSRFFPVSSAEICLAAVVKCLGRIPGSAMDFSPVEIDYDAFEDLVDPSGIRWVKVEVVLAMDLHEKKLAKARKQENVEKLSCREGWTDLPEEAFGEPQHVRPFYVCYPQLEDGQMGLSRKQFKVLKQILNKHSVELAGEPSTLFLDHISCPSSPEGERLADAMLLSQMIVLDDQVDVAKAKPFIRRGRCFMEAAAGVLTGNLLPVRRGQLEELDAALGAEISASETLRSIIKENSSSPMVIIKRLCRELAGKDFKDEEDRDFCVKLFEAILLRHPLLS